MPNFEMHGFSLSAARSMKKKIQEQFCTARWFELMVITNANSIVTDMSDKRAPFLRIYAEPAFYEAWQGELEVRLLALNIEYELAELRKYVNPKQL